MSQSEVTNAVKATQESGNDSGNSLWTSLVAGGIGGLVPLTVKAVLDRRRTEKREAVERVSLLRLIDAEIASNETKLGTIADSPKTAHKVPAIPSLQMDNWKSAKERLAQLIEPDHMEALVRYYIWTRFVIEYSSDHEQLEALPDENPRLQALAVQAKAAVEQGRAVRQRALEYLEELPTYGHE